MDWRRGGVSVGLGVVVTLLLWFVSLAAVFGGAVVGYRHRGSPAVAAGLGFLVGAVPVVLWVLFVLVSARFDPTPALELLALVEFADDAVAAGALGAIGAILGVALTGATGRRLQRRLNVRVDS